jgi:hypothetical protein
VATLSFATTDRKVFTPISSALANLPNAAGTIVVLTKKSVLGQVDFAGLTDSGPTNWYHSLSQDAVDLLWDDDGLAAAANLKASSAATDDTTNWWLYAGDWAGGAAGVERFHWRNQTTAGTWTHSPAAGTNGGMRTGPGTGGWLRLGFTGDESAGSKAMAVVAIWAGTRFADANYGTWSKTSDLNGHALGAPTFLCELTATTLVDLKGGSTYSSTNSTGTTLTGANPDNWTMDGLGSAVRPPARRIVRPRVWRPAGARFAR